MTNRSKRFLFKRARNKSGKTRMFSPAQKKNKKTADISRIFRIF